MPTYSLTLTGSRSQRQGLQLGPPRDTAPINAIEPVTRANPGTGRITRHRTNTSGPNADSSDVRATSKPHQLALATQVSGARSRGTAMPLVDRTKTQTRPAVHGAPCSVGQVYRESIDDNAELVELNSLLYLEGKDAGQVWAEFRSAGVNVARSSINKHRGMNCRCFTIDRDLWCMACRFDLNHCVCDSA